ncbi:CVNH domain-containing protein [Ancylobacter sp. A5.8]|uniref:CVNH domain-containing protein n=1 Tax=Ancylobacter gelatini TaxID=2919920 RepID=UPI001F4ECE7C|nr:CVNH domain-containing protein [Ancylobacter gelatini]MCJ8143710.1 CVNH domain-containing protein [Ancylobacter gelatini]
MMPRLLAFCLTMLALLSVMPDPASAQRAPSGSYLDTCRNVQQNRNWLSASCRDLRGRWQNSSLDLDRCPRGAGIANDNGRLVCGRGGGGGGFGPGPGMNRRPPPGTYMETCRNAAMFDGILQANCRTVNGRWVNSSIDPRRCRGDIANFNGQLRCR